MADIIQLPVTGWGATPDDWAHFDMVLGLTEDLLPVVSNLKATISPDSKMGGIGKTPSIYNSRRQVAGLPQWTQQHTTPEQVARWSQERDYGICIQTRRVRAIDIDIGDADESEAVQRTLSRLCGRLPTRTRPNSSKCLLVFECTAELYKRKFKTNHGIVELLATGQQFIAAGTHTSGVRYEWQGGLPDQIPTLTLAQVDELWAALEAEFAIEASTTSNAPSKAAKLSDVIQQDALAQHLIAKQLVKSVERDGRMHVTCPWEHEHTTDSGDSATTYWPAHTGGYADGGFKCLHSHCEHRTVQDLKAAVEFSDGDVFSDFDVISDEQALPADPVVEDKPKFKYHVQSVEDFCDRPMPEWIVKGLIPRAELGVMFGESGSGKSFLMLDIAAAIAQGRDWRGMKAKQGRVVFIAAEGAGGFRKRLQAYCHQHNIPRSALNIGTIDAAPNLKDKPDALELAKSIKGQGGADLVVIDTFAQSLVGNENSGEDVGLAIAHCKGIGRALGGAMVILIHHAGKDTSKGARGWSGLRAAADVELEVMRNDDARVLTVSKQKDGEDGGEFGFRLETVTIGLDDDDEEITSCIIEHTDTGRAAMKKVKGPKGNNERIVLECTFDLLDLDNRVAINDIINEAINRMPHEDGKRDRRREVAFRAFDSLVTSGRVLVGDGFVSLP